MTVEWFIARRYLTARRRQAFISLISAVSILGVGVGVMALVIALALMTGVQSEMRDRIVGSTAHVVVYGDLSDTAAMLERVTIPGVTGAAPAMQSAVLLRTNVVQPAGLKGIDLALEPTVTDIDRAMVTGSLAALANRPPDAKDGVVLGADLAQSLGARLGDTVWVLTPDLTGSPFGMTPRQRPLEVVGTFRFGFYQLDTTEALVTMAVAGELLRRSEPDWLQLHLANLDEAPAIRAQLEQALGSKYQFRDWIDMNGELYSALWLEKVAISLTIGLIVMVAALNIVASLVLLVMEKSRDIAILRTMGASSRVIRRIFIMQGLTIGLIGTIGGTVLGVAASVILDRYQLIKLSGEVYQIAYLPFHVHAWDIVIVVLSALAVCLVATLYPSRQAARIDPAEALRNQ
jgi:lipoprotein-releasing system permease protein